MASTMLDPVFARAMGNHYSAIQKLTWTLPPDPSLIQRTAQNMQATAVLHVEQLLALFLKRDGKLPPKLPPPPTPPSAPGLRIGDSAQERHIEYLEQQLSEKDEAIAKLGSDLEATRERLRKKVGMLAREGGGEGQLALIEELEMQNAEVRAELRAERQRAADAIRKLHKDLGRERERTEVLERTCAEAEAAARQPSYRVRRDGGVDEVDRLVTEVERENVQLILRGHAAQGIADLAKQSIERTREEEEVFDQFRAEQERARVYAHVVPRHTKPEAELRLEKEKADLERQIGKLNDRVGHLRRSLQACEASRRDDPQEAVAGLNEVIAEQKRQIEAAEEARVEAGAARDRFAAEGRDKDHELRALREQNRRLRDGAGVAPADLAVKTPGTTESMMMMRGERLAPSVFKGWEGDGTEEGKAGPAREMQAAVQRVHDLEIENDLLRAAKEGAESELLANKEEFEGLQMRVRSLGATQEQRIRAELEAHKRAVKQAAAHRLEIQKLGDELKEAKSGDNTERLDAEMQRLRALIAESSVPKLQEEVDRLKSLLEPQYNKQRLADIEREVAKVEARMKAAGFEIDPFAFDEEVNDEVKKYYDQVRERDRHRLLMDGANPAVERYREAHSETLEELKAVKAQLAETETKNSQTGSELREAVSRALQSEAKLKATELELQIKTAQYNSREKNFRTGGLRLDRRFEKELKELRDKFAGLKNRYGKHVQNLYVKWKNKTEELRAFARRDTEEGGLGVSGASSGRSQQLEGIRDVIDEILEDLNELALVPNEITVAKLEIDVGLLRNHVQAAEDDANDLSEKMESGNPDASLETLQEHYRAVGEIARLIMADVDRAESAWEDARVGIQELQHKALSNEERSQLQSNIAQFRKGQAAIRAAKEYILGVLTEVDKSSEIQRQLEERLEKPSADVMSDLLDTKKDRDDNIRELETKLVTDHARFETILNDLLDGQTSKMTILLEEIDREKEQIENRESRLRDIEGDIARAEREDGGTSKIEALRKKHDDLTSERESLTSVVERHDAALKDRQDFVDGLVEVRRLARDKDMLNELREAQIDEWVKTVGKLGQESGAVDRLRQVIQAGRTPRDLFALMSNPPVTVARIQLSDSSASTPIEHLAQVMQRYKEGQAGQIAIANLQIHALESEIATNEKQIQELLAKSDRLNQSRAQPRQETEEITSAYEDLRKQLQDVSEQVMCGPDELQMRCQALGRERDELRNRLDIAEGQRDERFVKVVAELEAVKEDLEKMTGRRDAALAMQIGGVENEEARRVWLDLMKDLERTRRELDRVRGGVSDEKRALEEKMEALAKKLLDVEEERAELRVKIAEAEERLRERGEENVQSLEVLEQRLEEQSEKLRREQEKVEECKKRLEEKQSKTQDAEATTTHDDLREKEEQLRRDREQLDLDRQTFEEAQQGQPRSALDQEADRLQALIREARSEVRKGQEVQRQKEEELRAFEAANPSRLFGFRSAPVKSEREEKREEVRKAEEAVRMCRDELERAEKELHDHMALQWRADHKRKVLERELNRKEGKLRAGEEQLRRDRQALDEKERQFQTEQEERWKSGSPTETDVLEKKDQGLREVREQLKECQENLHRAQECQRDQFAGEEERRRRKEELRVREAELNSREESNEEVKRDQPQLENDQHQLDMDRKAWIKEKIFAEEAAQSSLRAMQQREDAVREREAQLQDREVSLRLGTATLKASTAALGDERSTLTADRAAFEEERRDFLRLTSDDALVQAQERVSALERREVALERGEAALVERETKLRDREDHIQKSNDALNTDRSVLEAQRLAIENDRVTLTRDRHLFDDKIATSWTQLNDAARRLQALNIRYDNAADQYAKFQDTRRALNGFLSDIKLQGAVLQQLTQSLGLDLANVQGAEAELENGTRVLQDLENRLREWEDVMARNDSGIRDGQEAFNELRDHLRTASKDMKDVVQKLSDERTGRENEGRNRRQSTSSDDSSFVLYSRSPGELSLSKLAKEFFADLPNNLCLYILLFKVTWCTILWTLRLPQKAYHKTHLHLPHLLKSYLPTPHPPPPTPFPALTPPDIHRLVVHILIFTTLQTYLSTTRERRIWLAGNPRNQNAYFHDLQSGSPYYPWFPLEVDPRLMLTTVELREVCGRPAETALGMVVKLMGWWSRLLERAAEGTIGQMVHVWEIPEGVLERFWAGE